MKISIRAKNTTTHSKSSIENIILNIMPKYNYNQNIIAFNSTSIRKNTGFKITDKFNVWRNGNIAKNKPFKLLGVSNAQSATTQPVKVDVICGKKKKKMVEMIYVETLSIITMSNQQPSILKRRNKKWK